MSADICIKHDDLGWKNRTARCNRFWRAGWSRLEYVDIRFLYINLFTFFLYLFTLFINLFRIYLVIHLVIYLVWPDEQRNLWRSIGFTLHQFKLAVTVYRGIHGTAPRCLSDLLHRVSDATSRRRLQSSTSSELVIPLSRLVTVGDRSFAVAGPRLGNTLSEVIITSPPSLLVFRRKLKTHLFRQSYPDIIL